MTPRNSHTAELSPRDKFRARAPECRVEKKNQQKKKTKNPSLANTCVRRECTSAEDEDSLNSCVAAVPVGNKRRRNDVVMEIYIHRHLWPRGSPSSLHLLLSAQERGAPLRGYNGGCGFISRLLAYPSPLRLRSDSSGTNSWARSFQAALHTVGHALP